MSGRQLSVLLLLVTAIHGAKDGGKYSKSANERPSQLYPDEKSDIMNYAAVEEPFRMAKMNLLWEKARTRLADSKLQLLYSQLKVQDKDELTLKKLKSEGSDKEGLKEAEVRKKFSRILETFGLAGAGVEAGREQDKSQAKALFKDKKLARLWEKAEKSGLGGDELAALQEEFQHHQAKVDEYHALLELAGEDDHKRFNDIRRELDKEVFDIRDTNEYHRKGKHLKADYERLHKLATNQPTESGFTEPKVAGLWKVAREANFEPEELESLRQELTHYQGRLEKMHFLQAELRLVDERHGGKYGSDDDDKSEGRGVMDRKLGKQLEQVAKLHETLESRIISRHREL